MYSVSIESNKWLSSSRYLANCRDCSGILNKNDISLVTLMSEVSSSVETAEALLEAYRIGQRNFANTSLVSADLSGVDLKGADLSYADFSDADLSQASLRGADLSYARLCGTNLTAADLRGAMLIGTDLREAIVEQTQFQAADYDPDETHFPKGFDLKAAGMRADR